METKLVKIFSALVLFLLFLSGCAARTPFQPAQGYVYTDIKAPLSTNFVNLPTSYTLGEADIIYVGYSFLGISIGDVSLDKILKEENLEQSYYADYEMFSILNIFRKGTVRVWTAPRMKKS